jgi:hypothetical protein
MRERPQSDDEAARTDRCGQERLLIQGPGPEEKLCLTATFAESPDRACRTILATQVHWIHAKKAHEPQAQITVVVTVHDDGHVELDGDDLHLSLWNHDPAWLQSVLDQAGHHGLWKLRFHALFAPRYGGRILNLAALDHLTPCVADDDHSPAYTAETALERAARHARERGGYTVRLDSLRAAEARNHD